MIGISALVHCRLPKPVADRLCRKASSSQRVPGSAKADGVGGTSIPAASIPDTLKLLTGGRELEIGPDCLARVVAIHDRPQQSATELRKGAELRRLIEVFALGQIWRRLGESHFDRLEQAVTGMQAACKNHDQVQIAGHDFALHRCLVEATGNADLLAIWLPVASRMVLYDHGDRNAWEVCRRHAAMVAAIRRQDRAAAVQTLEATIR